MKRKRSITLLIAILFSLSNLFTCNAQEGTDVNVGSRDPFWANNYASEIERVSIRCARVSLVKTSDNTIVDRINICDAPYKEAKDYNVVSKMTKMEIANYDGKMPPVMAQSIANGYTGADILYPEQVSLPQLIIERGQSAVDFSNNLKNWFENEDNLISILNCFGGSEKTKELWNNKELCLLIEPMISIIETTMKGIFFTTEEVVTVLTCAEVGVMSNNGLSFKTTGSKNYDESMYKALPFSCFKVSSGLISAIPSYEVSSTNGFCTTSKDYLDMIKSLGCFEIAKKGDVPVATKSEIPQIDEPVAIEPIPRKIEYYTNTWVITGINVSSTNGFPYQSNTPGYAECSNNAKNNCLSGKGLAKINYSFSCEENLEIKNYTQSLAIPQNGVALSWVKWKTPAHPCEVVLHITSNSDDAILSDTEIDFNIIDPEFDTYPPNTEATDRNDNFIVPYNANGSSWDLGEKTSLSWATYNYNWHYDWHCICREKSHDEMCGKEISLSEYTEYGSSGGYSYEETDSGGRKKVYWHDCNTCSCNYSESVSDNHTCKHCTFSKEDWGWVEWTEVIHTALLNVSNINLKRSEHSPNTNNSDYSIKSGYGIELDLDTEIKNEAGGFTKEINSNNNEIIPPQFVETYLPEYKYEDYEIISKKNLDENWTSKNHFTFPINPYSQFEQNCHFTPIWYPDGKYVIGIRVSQCWTPAGMLYKCIYDTSINIKGNVYDDWHIAPQMN